jgi:hypothetical protein
MAAYRPRCVSNWFEFGAHAAAPHHLSGLPPPATAALESGAMVAVPIVNVATANAIASDVFIVRSPFDFVSQDHLELERDSNFPLKLALWRLPQLQDFFRGWIEASPGGQGCRDADQADSSNVGLWHLADILSGSLNVRFSGVSGHRVTLRKSPLMTHSGRWHSCYRRHRWLDFLPLHLRRQVLRRLRRCQTLR